MSGGAAVVQLRMRLGVLLQAFSGNAATAMLLQAFSGKCAAPRGGAVDVVHIQ